MVLLQNHRLVIRIVNEVKSMLCTYFISFSIPIRFLIDFAGIPATT